MKTLYTVTFLAVALLWAVPTRAQTPQDVRYKPFDPDPSLPWRRAEHSGPLEHDWYQMDFTSTSMPPAKLSECSITVEGPPDNYFVHRTAMQHQSNRICAIDWYVGELLVIAGSKQIVKCQDATSPPQPPPTPNAIVNYSYNSTCSFGASLISGP